MNPEIGPVETVQPETRALPDAINRSLALGALVATAFFGANKLQSLPSAEAQPSAAAAEAGKMACTKLTATSEFPCAWDLMIAARQRAIDEHPGWTFTYPTDEELSAILIDTVPMVKYDPIETIQILKGKSKRYQVRLSQKNRTTGFNIAEFENTDKERTFAGADAEGDLLVKKTVRFVPMLKSAKGRLYKYGRAVQQKNWDTTDPKKLFQYTGDSLKVPPITYHTARTAIKLPFSASQIRSKRAYLLAQQTCVARDPSYDPGGKVCSRWGGYAFRLRGPKTAYFIGGIYPHGDIVVKYNKPKKQ